MTKLSAKLFYTLSILGLLLVNFVAQPVFAAAPDDLAVLISDSRPSTAANYTFTHDQASGITFTDTNTLVLTFPAGFDLTAIVSPDDIDFKDASNDKTVQSGACGSTDSVRAVVSGQTITFTACNSYAESSAGAVIEIEIGSNATNGTAGTTRIVNHATPGSYSISSDTTQEDSKDALIAIISGVNVSATVDESLTVTINAVSAGASCDDNGGTPTEITTTATTVPFATINTEAFYNGCQRVDVDTNASGGYAASVRQTQLLTSGSNTVSEGSCDGSCNDTTLGGWETATNNGFGYCADDRTGNAAADAGIAAADQCDDATPSYYTFFTAPTAPTVYFMSSSSSVSGDQTNVSFHLSVPGSQAAGTYQNVMVYVVTATF